jgi:solute carrier family 35, member E1
LRELLLLYPPANLASFSLSLPFAAACNAAPPAFAETVKATEPISTVLIGLLFFSEGTSLRTYATLLPICCGVAISCFHNTSFHMLAFLLAAGSNFGFSSRAVFAKRLSLFYPDAIDEITLFSAISFLGLLLLVPLSLFMEGHKVYDMLESGYFTIPELLPLLALNGTCFAAYNLLSYVVLKRMDLVTHSVLNCFRRVFIIVATTSWFSETISVLNACGIAVAVLGVLLFGFSHTADKQATATAATLAMDGSSRTPM